MSCKIPEALFVQVNQNNHVPIGTYWTRTISVKVDGVARVYDSITLSGCIKAKDENNDLLEISLTEQVDDTTTGIVKSSESWDLNLNVATTSSVKAGIYDFTVLGTPADGKTYVELTGKIQFLEIENC